MGTVYLLHFNEQIAPGRHTTQHYLGWTAGNIHNRLTAHREGRGARLTQVAIERGIDWVLARTWYGDRTTERQLKRRCNGRRLCPICNPKP